MNEKEFEERLQAMHQRVLSKALSAEEETNYTESLFESIRHVNEYGEEFWYARELQIALEYKEWRNFLKVIKKAMTACNGSDNEVSRKKVIALGQSYFAVKTRQQELIGRCFHYERLCHLSKLWL